MHGTHWIFNRQLRSTKIEEEDFETISENQNTANTDNPIYSRDAEDDPFKDDI